MTSVHMSTPIANPRGRNGAETEFQGQRPIPNAMAVPENFMDESSIQLMNLDLTEKEDVADNNCTTPANFRNIQEQPKAESSHIPKPCPKLKPNDKGATAKTKLPSSSQPIYQNKYCCENCQQSFKNRILLERHVCSNNTKRQRGFNGNITRLNNTVVHKIQENHVEGANKTTLNTTKSTLNNPNATICIDNRQVYKTREAMYTPRKSLLAATTTTTAKKSPALKVGKRFACKKCDMKFASHLLLNLHVRKMCVTPIKKVPITDSSIPGLHKMITSGSETAQGLINTMIKKNGLSIDADITNTQTKTPVKRRYKDFGGIPVSSKLSLAFQKLKMQLQLVAPVENTDDGKNKVQ